MEVALTDLVWFRARRGQLAGRGETRRPVTDLEAEVSRLQRDILKRAASFAKAQLPSTH